VEGVGGFGGESSTTDDSWAMLACSLISRPTARGILRILSKVMASFLVRFPSAMNATCRSGLNPGCFLSHEAYTGLSYPA